MAKTTNYAIIKETERNSGGVPSGKGKWPPISTWIKNHFILKDISFCLKDGENLLILGENGAGKSTLARVLASLISSSNLYYKNEKCWRFIYPEDLYPHRALANFFTWKKVMQNLWLQVITHVVKVLSFKDYQGLISTEIKRYGYLHCYHHT